MICATRQEPNYRLSPVGVDPDEIEGDVANALRASHLKAQ